MVRIRLFTAICDEEDERYMIFDVEWPVVPRVGDDVQTIDGSSGLKVTSVEHQVCKGIVFVNLEDVVPEKYRVEVAEMVESYREAGWISWADVYERNEPDTD